MSKFVREGGKSFTEHQGRYRNPYPRGSTEHDEFERGWSQALKRSPNKSFNLNGEIVQPTSDLIDVYDQERTVVHRGETYRVRDNGAVLREPRAGGRRRKLDSKWTFGRPCKSTGYMDIAGVKVHRIVAHAFHGEAPSKDHIVDHIDTNRRNNRPENLRWITRLDNILKNPITLRRIEHSYGSVENFMKDPSQPKREVLPANYDWMRAVSKEEARTSLRRIQAWAESGKTPNGGSLGEWVFKREAPEHETRRQTTKESLTPGALQRNWSVPTEFPLCPDGRDEDSLSSYQKALTKGAVFSGNRFGVSKVIDAALNANGELCVVTALGGDAVKPFAAACVVRENEVIVHESGGTFFTLEGAVKAHCRRLGVSGKTYSERRGLPWGDSIDNYC